MAAFEAYRSIERSRKSLRRSGIIMVWMMRILCLILHLDIDIRGDTGAAASHQREAAFASDCVNNMDMTNYLAFLCATVST